MSRGSSQIPAGSRTHDGHRDGPAQGWEVLRRGALTLNCPSLTTALAWLGCRGQTGVVPCCAVLCHGSLCFALWCQQAVMFQGTLLLLHILTGLNAVELISCFPGFDSPQQGIINANQSHVILHAIRLQFNLWCPLPSHLTPCAVGHTVWGRIDGPGSPHSCTLYLALFWWDLDATSLSPSAPWPCPGFLPLQPVVSVPEGPLNPPPPLFSSL